MTAAEAANILSALVDAYADGEQSEAAGVVFAALDAAERVARSWDNGEWSTGPRGTDYMVALVCALDPGHRS